MKNELTPVDAMTATLTTGDARRLILATILELRNGSMPTDRGMAIAANMKVLNDSISAEINAAKMALMAKNEAHNFGQIVPMGQRVIGS